MIRTQFRMAQVLHAELTEKFSAFLEENKEDINHLQHLIRRNQNSAETGDGSFVGNEGEWTRMRDFLRQFGRQSP